MNNPRLSLLPALLAAALLMSSAAALAQTSGASLSAGIDLKAIDTRVNPCQDFYRYACGRWKATHKIPADQSSWSRMSNLGLDNQKLLRSILEQAENHPGVSPIAMHVGSFYASCMNTSRIDQFGITPLESGLNQIAAIHSRAGLAREIARLHREGVNVAFSFGSDQDAMHATRMIAEVDQGGLGLPDRSYYLKTDAKSVLLRKQYVAHVARMLELAGTPKADAARDAARILALETALAQASLSRVARRDPHQVYHWMTQSKFEGLAPRFDWTAYFAATQSPAFTGLNVAVPAFFTGLNQVLGNFSLNDWKVYLRWHLIHFAAPGLSAEFEQASFDFYGKVLTGAAKMEPRWQRCVRRTDQILGMDLGQLYVQRAFGPASRSRMETMVHNLEAALHADIAGLQWMTPATRERALVKLAAISNQVGYPDVWRKYDGLVIRRNDFLGNLLRGEQFEFHRQVAKIGHAVDRTEWEMTPPTVNAYYDPQLNQIVFPAGFLQKPFFNPQADAASNYGAIGAVIGHELTHGFDDQGRQYGPHGNLHNWWTAADASAFQQRAGCLVNQYGQFIAVGAVHVNGRLTLGENTADNGGVRIAYAALKHALSQRPLPAKDGYTPQQRFFISYAQILCSNRRPRFSRMLAQVDPHSPPQDRVDGPLSNFGEFSSAFHCSAGTPMNRAVKACRVW